MINYLQKLNYFFWAKFDNSFHEFNLKENTILRKEEQTFVDMYATRIVGNIASKLSEFYQNVYDKSKLDYNLNELSKKAEIKINDFAKKSQNFVKKDLQKTRDEFDIMLIEHGYLGDTFATASTNLYKSIHNKTKEMSVALDTTITNLSKNNSAMKLQNTQRNILK